MADIEAALVERASRLAPTQTQLDGAIRSHNYLREVLSTGQMECRIQGSYLSGSYARQTAIRPLDDVDVVFEIDPTQWRRNPLQQLFNQLPSPAAVLETFARAIRRRYPSSSVRTQRRSVGLVLEHLQIDVVPAVPDENKDGWLWIADGDAGTWLSSAPRVHSEVATSVNNACGGLFKPLVRLLKGWNDGLPSTAHFKSFAVETMATRLFAKLGMTSLTQGTHQFFDFVAWLGGHAVAYQWSDSCGVSFGSWNRTLPDVAGSGSNLLGRCEAERVEKFSLAARVMRDALGAAQSARTFETAWAQVSPRLLAGMQRL